MAIESGAIIRIREIEKDLPVGVRGLMEKREGAALLVRELPKFLASSTVADSSPEQAVWEQVGLFYVQQNRWYEAILIFAALYEQMLRAQKQTGDRCHKGMPLIWMSDCYRSLGYSVISQRYLMLTLVEDAIRENGSISPETTGTYFRAVWLGGLSDGELRRYAKESFDLNKSNPVDAFYPEWVVRQDVSFSTRTNRYLNVALRGSKGRIFGQPRNHRGAA